MVARYDELRSGRRRRAADDLEDRLAGDRCSRPASDKSAAKLLDETATYLGAGIADLINLFNPERVVIGGWLGQLLGDRLLPRINEAASRHALRLPFSQVSIVEAQLGKDAVALGAATLPIASVLSSGAVVAKKNPARTRRLEFGRATGEPSPPWRQAVPDVATGRAGWDPVVASAEKDSCQDILQAV